MPDASLFGNRLKELREAAGLTQKALAAIAGVGQSAIAQWEAGIREPGWSKVVAIAQALGVECTAFLLGPGGEAGKRRAKKKKSPRPSPRKGESEG